ncbi:MAG: hypothetical protein N3B13_04630 [Deltaproteobacteria bacterium]|nr:hypothetical protein [Deltaproteobacteria bacterium]
MNQRAEELIKEIQNQREMILNSDIFGFFPETKELTEQFFSDILDKKFENNHIYQMEADIVTSLARGAFVNINSYNKSERKLEIVAVAGIREFVELILKFGNIRMVGKKLSLEDKFAELSLLQGKLHRIPRGLKDAALKGFPDMLVDLVDEMLGPFFCYGAGFVYQDELVGNLAIIGKNVDIQVEKEEVINLLLPVFALVEMVYRDIN